MRQTYIPSKQSYQMYKTFFQTGSGYDTNGYIYSNQTGSGIGGFLRSVLKFAMPIGKKLLFKGYEMIKPELKSIAKSGVGAVTRVAETQIKKSSKKVQKRFNSVGKSKKRKLDTLGS